MLSKRYIFRVSSLHIYSCVPTRWKLSAGAVIHAAFRCHGVKWYIPGFRRYPRRALKFVCEPQHAGLVQIVPLAEKPETAIVIAAPHTQSMSARVECNQGCQDQVQRGQADAPIVHPFRFQNPVAVCDQRVIPGIRRKPEPLHCKRDQYRKVDPFPERPEQLNKWPGIYFAVGREVYSNMPTV